MLCAVGGLRQQQRLILGLCGQRSGQARLHRVLKCVSDRPHPCNHGPGLLTARSVIEPKTPVQNSPHQHCMRNIVLFTRPRAPGRLVRCCSSCSCITSGARGSRPDLHGSCRAPAAAAAATRHTPRMQQTSASTMCRMCDAGFKRSMFRDPKACLRRGGRAQGALALLARAV